MENIIYVAAPRDWFDYISSILTFAFSLVAIIIAVSTARRQNKIAMFEKREEVIDYLFELLKTWEALALVIVKQSDSKGVLKASEYAIVSRIRKTNGFFDMDRLNSNYMFEEIRKIELMDVMYIQKTTRLFQLSVDQEALVTKFGKCYQELIDEIIEALKKRKDQNCIKKKAVSFLLLSVKESTKFVKSLEKQTKISS